jgi:hypothetical protein
MLCESGRSDPAGFFGFSILPVIFIRLSDCIHFFLMKKIEKSVVKCSEYTIFVEN